MTGTTARDYLTAAINAHHLVEDDLGALEVQMLATLSIAASLHTIAETMTAPTPVTGELVAAGCCRRDAVADDLLEYAFGIICNADNSISAGGHLKDEWKQAARRFIDRYNAKVVGNPFGGSVQDLLIRAQAALADLKADGGAL